jgi:hypothetical protein
MRFSVKGKGWAFLLARFCFQRDCIDKEVQNDYIFISGGLPEEKKRA